MFKILFGDYPMLETSDLLFIYGDADDEAQAEINEVNNFTESWLLGITPIDTYLDFIQERLCNVEDHLSAYELVLLEHGFLI